MPLSKDELRYRASLNAVDQRFGVLKVAIPIAILGWPVVMAAGGVGAVVGLGVLGIGAIATAYRGANEDWDKIDQDDRVLLAKLTPKRYKRDLYAAYAIGGEGVIALDATAADAVPTTTTAAVPNTPPPILRLRPESHLMLIAPTRGGKTSALWGLLPDNADVVYVSLKPDSIPVSWTGYRISPTDASGDVNAVLDRVEPLIHAMLSGSATGSVWFVCDEVLGITALCDRTTADRLLKLIMVTVTAGAGVGAFTALLMQSPNASDLGISAALMRNFQAVVLASERSGFDHFADWAGRFAELSPAAKTTIAGLDSGFWAVSGGGLFKPAACLSATKKCSPVMMSSSSSSSSSSPVMPSPVASPAVPSSSSSSSPCPECGAGDVVKNGAGRVKCKSCGKSFAASPPPPINSWGV